MATMKHRMFWRALATFCVLAIVIAAASALFWTGDSPAVADDGSEQPAIPASLVVFTQQGSLDVELDWGEVEKVTHYLIRWRSVDKGEKLNAGVEEKSTNATIKVADYGSWVVRVQACNEAGDLVPVAVASAPGGFPVGQSGDNDGNHKSVQCAGAGGLGGASGRVQRGRLRRRSYAGGYHQARPARRPVGVSVGGAAAGDERDVGRRSGGDLVPGEVA